MKKITVIISCLLIVCGISLFTVALGMADWDFSELSTVEEFEIKTAVFENNGLDIRIDGDNADITVKKSSDGKIHLEYFENKKEYFNITEDGTLSIKQVEAYRWYDYIFNIDFRTRNIVLSIPEGYEGHIDIIGDNGAVTVTDISVTGELNCQVDNGNVSANSISAERITLTSDNGKLNISDCEAESINIFTDNGRLNISRITASALFGETHNGKVTLNSINADTISLLTHNGDINGSVFGNMGDYKIQSETNNGDNTLPSSKPDGDRSMNIFTHNGDIKISFLG